MEESASSSSSVTMVSTPEHHDLTKKIFPKRCNEEPRLKEFIFSEASICGVENHVTKQDHSDMLLRILTRKQKRIGLMQCGICMDVKRGDEMFRNRNCCHYFCVGCIGGYVAEKIEENILLVKCPEAQCKGVLEAELFETIIPKEVFDRWDNGPSENVELGLQMFYCPFKECSANFIDDPFAVTSQCPRCRRLFCAKCKVLWHEGLDCTEFLSLKKERRRMDDLLALDEADSHISSWGMEGASSASSSITLVSAADEDDHILFFCGICMDAKTTGEMFETPNCYHAFCEDCVGRYVFAKVVENISEVKCPDPECSQVIESRHCRSVLTKEVFDRWEDNIRENLEFESQLYCPFKDCSAMLITDEEDVVSVSECPYCKRQFCARCKVPWHAGVDCIEFQGQDIHFEKLATKKSWKRCPKCSFYVESVGGCSRIRCRCGDEFCYSCGLKWDSSKHYTCQPR
ncbi:unnamed protein product [Sphenostylis stenocarpa]|uniref:RBR-type E3 ubiquitin transferase n=1 Tax=Sphenostylis stenocarpa TaxID=92480 RepID=A0AA86SBD5_9FABA|nr:unnamed protein product [Sphenostylis stenocarpa]